MRVRVRVHVRVRTQHGEGSGDSLERLVSVGSLALVRVELQRELPVRLAEGRRGGNILSGVEAGSAEGLLGAAMAPASGGALEILGALERCGAVAERCGGGSRAFFTSSSLAPLGTPRISNISFDLMILSMSCRCSGVPWFATAGPALPEGSADCGGRGDRAHVRVRLR